MREDSFSIMAKNIESLYEGLTDKQRIFVDTYMDLGGGRGAQVAAARKAGYSEKSVHAAASQLLRNERILSAIRKLTGHKFRAGAVMALETLIYLTENATTEATRLKASEGLLNRCGFGPQSTQDVNVNLTDNRSQQEIVDAIAQKLEDLKNIEPRLKELQYRPGVLDVEFTEVDLENEISEL